MPVEKAFCRDCEHFLDGTCGVHSDAVMEDGFPCGDFRARIENIAPETFYIHIARLPEPFCDVTLDCAGEFICTLRKPRTLLRFNKEMARALCSDEFERVQAALRRMLRFLEDEA